MKIKRVLSITMLFVVLLVSGCKKNYTKLDDNEAYEVFKTAYDYLYSKDSKFTINYTYGDINGSCYIDNNRGYRYCKTETKNYESETYIVGKKVYNVSERVYYEQEEVFSNSELIKNYFSSGISPFFNKETLALEKEYITSQYGENYVISFNKTNKKEMNVSINVNESDSNIKETIFYLKEDRLVLAECKDNDKKIEIIYSNSNNFSIPLDLNEYNPG